MTTARLALLLAIVLAVPASASAQVLRSGSMQSGSFPAGGAPPPPIASCTDGVNCYCDNVAPGGPLADPLLLVCEDFEDDQYYTDTGANWTVGSGSPYNRGLNSKWNQLYGDPSYEGNSLGTDPTPYIGTACGAPVCSGYRVYCSATQGALTAAGVADCWGPGMNADAQIWIARGTDFSDETAFDITGGHGADDEVGAGNSYKIEPVNIDYGDNGTGIATWSNVTEVGVTMLHAYSPNIIASGINSYPWKHDEYIGSTASVDYKLEHWNLGNTGHYLGNDYFPYQPFIWTKAGFADACVTSVTNATIDVGAAHCEDFGAGGGALMLTANGSAPVHDSAYLGYQKNSGVTNYYRPTDWPYGTWACHRAHIKNMGSANMELTIWHNDTIVFHMSGFDTTPMENQNYNKVFWNAYSNRSTTGPGLLEKTYRMRDNIHIRNGPPVSCSQIENNG